MPDFYDRYLPSALSIQLSQLQKTEVVSSHCVSSSRSLSLRAHCVLVYAESLSSIPAYFESCVWILDLVPEISPITPSGLLELLCSRTPL